MNQKHEPHSATSSAAIRRHDETSEPGQSSRSALLHKRDDVVASALVQCKTRNANGVADGAAHAVAAASSSSGARLPAALMRKFEISLGVDLSGVRIHNGDTSARAANAVNAKAYTIGNDIHFGAGHYDPSSSAGQHLLAHEVAHTVQQAAGAHRMQCKLERSSSGDDLEDEADRKSIAMVAEAQADPAAKQISEAEAKAKQLEQQAKETREQVGTLKQKAKAFEKKAADLKKGLANTVDSEDKKKQEAEVEYLEQEAKKATGEAEYTETQAKYLAQQASEARARVQTLRNEAAAAGAKDESEANKNPSLKETKDMIFNKETGKWERKGAVNSVILSPSSTSK